MKLLDYMRQVGVDDEGFARLVGDCSSHAVRKWKYGERQPSADKACRIEQVTRGLVRLRDLVIREPSQ